MTCGYAIELVRSCYAGWWRLFRNAPDQLTRMRYYFVSDDTPVYQGWHFLGSGNWVANAEEPYQPPALGQDTSQGQVYSNGLLGTDSPPVALVGSADCLSSGEVYPPQDEGRRLIAGIDSRCWTDKGFAVPDQIPRLWFTEDGIKPPGTGAPPTLWVDESVHKTDADQLSQPINPVTATFDGHKWVANNGPGFFKPLSVVPFGRDFAFHVVARILNILGPPPAAVGLCAFEIPSSPFIITPTEVITWPGIGGQLTMANPVGYTGTHLWSLRREDGNLTVYLDGVLLGAFSVDPVGAYKLVCCNGTMLFTLAGSFAMVGHIKLYDAWIGQPQFEADMDVIKALYAIP